MEVSGITGVTIRSQSLDRVSDTKATVELEFNGDFDTDGTLTFTVGAAALANYNGPALTAQISVSSITEPPTALIATTAAPLTEATLHDSVVTLTLSGATYDTNWNYVHRNVEVSGITGVTIRSQSLDRVSDTKATVELEFNGDFDTDGTLTFTVGAAALANYNGPALTAQISVSSITEPPTSLIATTTAPLTEATLHDSVITLTLSGATYDTNWNYVHRNVEVSGITGVTIRSQSLDRVSDTKATVELEFNGDFDTDGTLTFTVGAAALANYNGPALTAQISVSSITEPRSNDRSGTKATVEPTSLIATTAAPLTEATLHESVITLTLSGGTFERNKFTIRDAITLTGIAGVTVDTFGVDRVSDTEATVELAFDGNMTSDSNLTISLGADAIKDYDGAALTSQISVSAVTESITASTASTLTEATLDGSVVTLTLSGRKYERWSSTIRPAVSVSGISGVTVESITASTASTLTEATLDGSVVTLTLSTYDIDRESDTEITVELTFDGDITTDGTLAFTVGAGAIAGYNGPAFTVQVSVSAGTETPVVTDGQTPVTPQQPGDKDPPKQPNNNTGGTPTLSVTATPPLTEATLHGGIITLNLSSGTFRSSIFWVRNAVSVSGITGVTLDPFGGERISDTQATIELEYEGNMTANGTLTISVGAGAIEDYDGATLTSQLSISAVTESIAASTVAPLTEATLDENVITLTLSGRKFERFIFDIRDAVSVSGIADVTVGTFDIDRESDTEVTVELTFDGNMTSNGTLTFTVGADAIAGYNGPAFTAQVSVSAGTETLVVADGQTPVTPQQPGTTGDTPTLSTSTAAPITEATLHGGIITFNLSGGTFRSSIFWIRNAVSVSGIAGVTLDPFGGERISDTQATIELEYDGNMIANGTLTVSVESGAIEDYDGAALNSQLSISAVTESIAASTAAPLTEATLDESVITLTLSGRKFERFIFDIRDAVSVSGIADVTVGTFDIDRESDTEVTVELTFDGNMTSNGTLTFTVGADAIAGYNGPAFTAQVSVTASRENALGANFPNPFNPETWIPYKLAKPAEVTLHIYAVNGTLVRTLSLGHQAAGMYQSRSRAAYWDGRNEFGEKVASGLYFYTLTAGDFSATRKMLIRK